ncbi:MAG: hypothetical protein HRT71_01260 [Flavobacteriales bacterium]|nr:hypothetical protein [Flavobacteriales bacterium]
MDTKLTLSLNKLVIEQAKTYAKTNKISLSKLIESYLSSLTNKYKNETEITPLVESLSGVISIKSDTDLKEDYTDYLHDKHK